jgi:hypothetical protein
MVLAGGTLALAACSSSNTSGALDGGNDGQLVPDVSGMCCNASPDPCCPSKFCEASVSMECEQETACQADGGTWSYSGGCSLADAGGPPDAAPADAPADAPGDQSFEATTDSGTD